MDHDCSISNAIPDHQLGHSDTQKFPVEKPPVVRHPSSKRSLARSIAIVATCTGAMLVNISNSTSMSISLPVIEKSINIQENQLQWLMSAYSLSSGCLLLFCGRLADLYGRKKGFLIGMFWQMAFALGLGFSSNGFMLVILRGFQGMGAAFLLLFQSTQSFPPSHARSIAFATFSAGGPVGAALGCVIGGVLTQLSKEHWRAPFFLSASLSALCILGATISFDTDMISSEADPRVDWIGAILVTSGLVLIVLVLGQGPTAGWKTPYIIACLVIGLVLLGIFMAWEHHLEKSAIDPDKPKSFWTAPPLMKLSIWTRAKGRMAVILAIPFLTWCGVMSWMYWVQLFYQDYLGLTPVLSVLRLMPMFVSGCLCNVVFAMVVSKLPLVVFIVLGTLFTGLASVLFAVMDPSATYWAFEFPSTIIVVFGADFVYSSGTLFVSTIAFPHEQSLAGGLFQTMTQVGTTFGLAISTIVFNCVVDTQSTKLGVVVNSLGTNAPTSVKLQGYRSTRWTSAAFPFFASLLAAIFLRKVGIVGHRKNMEEESSEQTATEQQSDAEP
ncbi:Major facilitator superfamily domain containing protein [Tylopilus felleus]